jgi:hypothetical protein
VKEARRRAPVTLVTGLPRFVTDATGYGGPAWSSRHTLSMTAESQLTIAAGATLST